MTTNEVVVPAVEGRVRIEDFHNLHANEPGVLICNGPSLKGVPNEWLEKYITLGSNSVYVKGVVVNYYFLEGAGHLKKPEEREARMPYVEHVGKCGGYSFINRRFVHYFEHLPNVRSIDYVNLDGVRYTGFSFEPLHTHGTGACVTYPMLQVGFYLGLDPLLIVGMDHKFDGDTWHFYKDSATPEFHSMQLKEYDKYIKRVEPHYQRAKEVFNEYGRTLLNLTPDTACDVFEKDKLENWL